MVRLTYEQLEKRNGQHHIWSTMNDEEMLRSANLYAKDFSTGKEGLTLAAILLFGKNPQSFFPRAFIRFIRYDGIEAKVGAEMNVIKPSADKLPVCYNIIQYIRYLVLLAKAKNMFAEA